MQYAPDVAKAILSEVISFIKDGNVNAGRHVSDFLTENNISVSQSRKMGIASDFSDALADVLYLVEQIHAGKWIGEVLLNSRSLIEPSALLRHGVAEDVHCNPDDIKMKGIPEDERQRQQAERDILDQLLLLLDIYETSLKEKDAQALKRGRAEINEQLAAARKRAQNGDSKAKKQVMDLQSELDNFLLPASEKRMNHGVLVATSLLRNHLYAKILSTATSCQITHEEPIDGNAHSGSMS